MTIFTFWNVDERSDVAEMLARLAIETRCDILATAETGGVHLGLEFMLQTTADPNFLHMTPREPKVHVWTRLDIQHFRPVASEAWFEAFELRAGAAKPVLVVLAHLPAKPGRPPEREWNDAKLFAASIRDLERRHGTTQNTLLLGDLNLHPHDRAMRYPEALNAGSSRRVVADRPVRTRRGVAYDRFYNPTWNLLGDANGPPGTHFWHGGGVDADWYMLDQVLLRAGLIPRLQLQSLRVVTTIGRVDLIEDNGRLAKRWPDHLPLSFELGS